MRNIVSRLLTSWEAYEVIYCCWETDKQIELDLNGADVDILVAGRCRVSCKEILREYGYLELSAQQGNRRKGAEEWLGMDPETGKLVHIRIYYTIDTAQKHVKKYAFPLAETALESREKNEYGIYVINPHVEIIALYMRIALEVSGFEKGSADAYDKANIERLKRRVQHEEMREYVRKIFREKADAVIGFFLAAGMSEQERKSLKAIIGSYFVKDRRYHEMLGFHAPRFYRYLQDVKEALNSKGLFIRKKAISGRGIAFCFIGCDGCGKSTLSRDFEKWFGEKLDCRKFFLGSGDHYDSPLKRLAIRSAEVTRAVGSEKLSLKGRLRKIAGAFSTLVNVKYKIKTLREIRKYVRRGGIAVIDRFPQTQFEGVYDGPKIKFRYNQYFGQLSILRWLSAIGTALIQKCSKYEPDLVFKLHIPAEEAINRKPDHNYEEILAKIQITEALQFTNAAVINVNAAMDYAAEQLEIKNKIWYHIAK